jgi:hypothetical protein
MLVLTGQSARFALPGMFVEELAPTTSYALLLLVYVETMKLP